MRKGQPHSPETKAKISATKTGKLFTEEHSRKIGDALRGVAKTEEHKKAISEGIKTAKEAIKKLQLENVAYEELA